MDDPPEEITSAEAVAYEEAIPAAIAKENRKFKNYRGLAEYIHEDALKVRYIAYIRPWMSAMVSCGEL